MRTLNKSNADANSYNLCAFAPSRLSVGLF